MTTNPTRFTVSLTARDILCTVNDWQMSDQLDVPADLPARSSANDWPRLDGMTRMHSEGDDLFNLIRLAWDSGLINGPAEPRFNYEWDEDGGSALYSVRLGAYPGRVNLSTVALDWKETADVDAIGVDWAVSALLHAAMHLNAELHEFEHYIAAIRPAPALATAS